MQVLATAAAGMFAAADRLSASAQRTASWGLEETQSSTKEASTKEASTKEASTKEASAKVDLVQEAVQQISAKTEFKANAAVIRTADEMTGALLDIKA